MRFIKNLTLLLTVIALTGCFNIRALREAQDLYNKSAEVENRTKLENSDSLEFDSKVAYLEAIEILDDLDKYESELKEENLWDSKEFLHALCLWKAGNYDISASKAQTLSSSSLGTRDQIVIVALPGLIKIDQANDILKESGKKTNISEDIYKEIEKLLINSGPANLTTALKDLDDAISQARAKKHGIQNYLYQAQLTAFMVLKEAKFKRKINRNLSSNEVKKLKTIYDNIKSNTKLLALWEYKIGIALKDID